MPQGAQLDPLDLAALATDPDPEDQGNLTFELKGSTPQGLTADVDGTTLRVSAAANTAKGTRALLTVTADDGETEPAEATISVEVTASTRQLASANDDVIEQSDQGSTESVAVLANDVNPFPDKPLTLDSAVLETGQAQVTLKGDRVEVTSNKTYVGTVVVRYRVMDATEDADRAVDLHISRELGIPAVVGTGSATSSLQDGAEVTVSCAEGDTGFIYEGIAEFEKTSTSLDEMPELPVKVMMNVGTPDQAFLFSKLPNRGVGLARLDAALPAIGAAVAPDTQAQCGLSGQVGQAGIAVGHQGVARVFAFEEGRQFEPRGQDRWHVL